MIERRDSGIGMRHLNLRKRLYSMKTQALTTTLLLALSTLSHADAPFVVSADGKEVTDSRNGLIWKRCAEGMVAKGGACAGTARTFSYDEAAAHAVKQASATKVAWRLPTSEELLGIGDEKRFKMAIDTSAFPGTPPDHFWTSTRYIENYYYAVNFYNGFHYDRYYTSPHYVRLVRAGR
jgi:hypothetical protein